MSSLAAAVLPGLALASGGTLGGASATSEALQARWNEAERHYLTPVSSQPIGQRFAELAATWREERGFSSSITDIVMSPSYQRVIALGQAVVPYVLADLAMKPDHWFWALSAITGVDPIPDEVAGNLKGMTEAWLKWGDQEGVID